MPVSAFISAVTRPRFKGGIAENAARFKLLGGGYKSMPPEQNGHFDLRTARHLTGPLRALADPLVRMVFIVGAVQVLKSVVGDITVIYWIEHTQWNIMAVFEDDKKAKEYSQKRLKDTILGHPVIAQMIADMREETDRHQVTNTLIRFAGGRSFTICGANDGNLSTFSTPLMWSSEAWQWAPGMLQKFIRRADRYPDTHKILIESQAGLADGDFHTEVRGAHPVPLTWACPYCGGRQTWECEEELDHLYEKLRPAGFTPLQPHSRPEGELALWVPPQPGTYAGMKWAPPSRTVDGEERFRTIEERARSAYWECYHCGTAIQDLKELRRQIADSYDQTYTTPSADGRRQVTPKWVAFYLPKEAMWNNSFASGVKNYLTAREKHEAGDPTALQDWCLQERALFFSLRALQVKIPVIVANIADPAARIPHEWQRVLSVDCQQSREATAAAGKSMAGHFWWVGFAIDRQGNFTQLARGYATSWEELFGPEGVQTRLQVPNRHVLIDGGNWEQTVLEMAAKYAKPERALSGAGMALATWKVMHGDDGKGTRWEDGVWRPYWPPKTHYVDTLGADGKWSKVIVQSFRWSNFVFKSVLLKIRQGHAGQPRLTAVDVRTCSPRTQAMEKGEATYEHQMSGLVMGEDAKGRPKIIELHKQQHYPDCTCQALWFALHGGKLRGLSEDRGETEKP